jgi:UrcA family protein
MLLTHLIAAAMLATAPASDAEAPLMRVPLADLDLTDRADAAVLAGRIADESRRVCEAHREVLTPSHVGDPSVCERAMAQAAVSALPDSQWRAFVRAGGKTELNRRQG